MQSVAISSTPTLFLQLVITVCAAQETNMLLLDFLLIQLIRFKTFNMANIPDFVMYVLPKDKINRLLRRFMGGADPICCLLV